MLSSPEPGGVGQEQDPAAPSLRGCCWQGKVVELALQALLCSPSYLKGFEVRPGTSA